MIMLFSMIFAKKLKKSIPICSEVMWNTTPPASCFKGVQELRNITTSCAFFAFVKA